MKIIKNKPEPENLEELFGKKKQPAPAPEKPGINRAWDNYYNVLEDIRKSGVNQWAAIGYFREGINLSDELAAEIFYSWVENYDELSKLLHWD